LLYFSKSTFWKGGDKPTFFRNFILHFGRFGSTFSKGGKGGKGGIKLKSLFLSFITLEHI
jgi:hypothetical protein